MQGSGNRIQVTGEAQIQPCVTSDALTITPTIIDQWAGGWSDRLRSDVVHDRRDAPTALRGRSDWPYRTDNAA